MNSYVKYYILYSTIPLIIIVIKLNSSYDILKLIYLMIAPILFLIIFNIFAKLIFSGYIVNLL